MKKVVRVATIPMSLNILLKGQLEYLSDYYEVTAVSGAGPDLDAIAQREGVKVYPIDIERPIAPVDDLVSLIRLYLYFLREKPAVVHSITPKAGLLSMVAAKAAGVPVRIHTFTGLIFPSKTGAMQRLLIAMDRLMCHCATHIYPEGNGVRNDLLNYKITDKPLKIIANGNVNGTDLTYFNPDQVTDADRKKLKKDLGIHEEDFVFIFVGRIVKDKGIEELIEAFKALRLKHTVSSFHFKCTSTSLENGLPFVSKDYEFADGNVYSYTDTRPYTEQKTAEEDQSEEKPDVFTLDAGDLNISVQESESEYQPKIKLLLVGSFEQHLNPVAPETFVSITNDPDIMYVGFQHDIRPYMAVSDAFVFPSYREGFPNVVIQAGAMELPSIVSDINGCNEIVSDCENGLIVPAKNTEALQEAMQRISEDHTLYHTLKSNSRNCIVTRYDNSVVWEALKQEYDMHLEKLKK